ncbi:hypothetical protein N787_00080 [Arenimonas metalli CF5-1]|uniref:Uncharacterized protein n=2 Tax=Arenimonas TaxID=490567 RepID=A0A091B6T9_9GAMM|nr:hypothetical protein N787_00080 [Arenimonas metalli CF5-1]
MGGMDGWLLVGIALLLTALPGLGLGLVLVTGLWRPRQLEDAADPDRLRRSVGFRALAVAGAVAAPGAAILVMRG